MLRLISKRKTIQFIPASAISKYYNTSTSYPIKRVGMIGMGLMGHGIAQAAATAGYDVIAYDINDKFVQTGIENIKKSVTRITNKSIEKNKLTKDEGDKQISTILNKIKPTTNLSNLTDCDLIIEAIIEDKKIKQEFYKKLSKTVKNKDCIFASNTSSLSINDIAQVTDRPSKVLGIHFFNPVQVMKLVELIKTKQTDPLVMEICKKFIESIHKTPVNCNDTPGFIVNRLLIPNITQALLMMERGDATKEDIDISMQLGAGNPMGPITLADYVGLDTVLAILTGWVHKFPNEKTFVIPDILKKKVQEGKLGRKSGEGFYKWKGDKKIA